MPQVFVGVRPVDGAVAIAASPQEGHRLRLSDHLAGGGRIVAGDDRVAQNAGGRHIVVPEIGQTVARQTDRRLRSLQQVGRNSAVGVVAERAVFHYRGMLEGPGPGVFLVTRKALGRLLTEYHLAILVRIVTADAGQGAFADGMVTRQLQK